MKRVFSNCYSLKRLPDISKWITNNVKDISGIFENCISLIYLPDISKWNLPNITNITRMFYNCPSLISYPDISILGFSNNVIKDDIFSKSSSTIDSISFYSNEKNYIKSNSSSNDDNNIYYWLIPIEGSDEYENPYWIYTKANLTEIGMQEFMLGITIKEGRQADNISFCITAKIVDD